MAKKNGHTKELKKLQSVVAEMKSALLEREDHVDTFTCALLSGENVFFIGKPGTAKSMMCREYFGRIKGASYFEWLMSKTTVPEELFGPVDLDKYMNEQNFSRNTEDKLPEATFAFLDEPGKASSSILNTLLTLINEKKFHNGRTPQDVPLRSLVSASNEFFEGEEMEALFDRYVVKLEVVSINERVNRIELLSGNTASTRKASITLKELDTLVASCKEVEVPDDIIKTILKIQDKLREEGIWLSDRVLYRTCANRDRNGDMRPNILKAHALLNGRTEVNEDDLMVLEHCFWHTIEERDKISVIIKKMSNPDAMKVDTIIENSKSLHHDAMASSSSMETVFQAVEKLKQGEQELEDIIDHPRKKRIHGRAKKALKVVQGYREEIVREKLG